MERAEQADYFLRRAEEERIAADQARDERAAQTHRALAERYDDIANGARQQDWEGPSEDGGTLSSDFTILP